MTALLSSVLMNQKLSWQEAGKGKIALLAIVLAIALGLLIFNNLPKTGLLSLSANPSGNLGIDNSSAKGEYTEPTKPYLGSGPGGVIYKENNNAPSNQETAEVSAEQPKCEMFFGQCYENLNAYLKKKADAIRKMGGSGGSGGGGGGGGGGSGGSTASLQKQLSSPKVSTSSPPNPGPSAENALHKEKVHSSLLAELDGTSQAKSSASEKVKILIDAGDEDNLAKIVSEAKSLGGANAQSFRIGGIVSVELPKNKVLELAGNPSINYIYPEQKMKLLLNKAVPQLKASSFWQSGFRGKGVKVAVIDTGVDSAHLMLKGKIAAEKNFSEEADAADS